METKISIIGTSDLHGHIENLDLFAGYLQSMRNSYLLLDAGDMFSGTVSCDQTKGQSVINLYNSLGYDAVALGNHEFDYGIEELKNRIFNARFPFLCSNIKHKGQRPNWTNLLATTIFIRDGIRIGVVGGITQETPKCTNCPGIEDYSFEELAVSIQERVDVMKSYYPPPDVIIVLVHKGVPVKTPAKKLAKLANMLQGVNVIVGGHTHGAFHGFINDIAVIQSYSLGRYFGRIDLYFEGKNLLSQKTFIHKPQPIIQAVYEGRLISADYKITRELDKYLDRSELIARSNVLYEHFLDEQGELDYLMAELFLFGTKLTTGKFCDLALLNKGAIRASIVPGMVTKNSLFEVMPFRNKVKVIKVYGFELEEILERDTSKDLILSGKGKLDQLKEYKVAISDYLRKILFPWKGGEDVLEDVEPDQVEIIKEAAKSFYVLPRIYESVI